MPVHLKVHQRASGLSDGASKEYELSVDGLSTIADLKRAIRDATGVPADLQALFHHNPSVPGGRGAEVFLHDEMTVYHAIGSDHDPSQRHVVYLNVDESGGTEAAGKEHNFHGREGK